MTGKEFMRSVTNGRVDLVQIVLDILARTQSDYCVIGGLAVNAYADPVVSLDLDIVVTTRHTGKVADEARSGGLGVESFEHSLNLSTSDSDLRVQIQTDERYQDFIGRARLMRVLGYDMNVATAEDVLQGKVWAYQDASRRKSKRQKDLADIIRLIEAQPDLENLLPESLRREIK